MDAALRDLREVCKSSYESIAVSYSYDRSDRVTRYNGLVVHQVSFSSVKIIGWSGGHDTFDFVGRDLSLLLNTDDFNDACSSEFVSWHKLKAWLL